MKKICFLGLAMLLTQLSFGQFSTVGRYINGYNKANNKWYYHNFQIGVNMHMPMNGLFNLEFHDVNLKENKDYKASYKAKAEVPTAFNAFAASAKNLGAIGAKSGIALTFGVDFSASIQTIDMQVKSTPHNSTNLNFIQAFMAVPIGLAYRTGGMYTNDKADKFSFSLGIGVAPSLSNLVLDPFVDRLKFRLPAFVTAELGFVAGINWVVRANMYPGNIHGAFNQKTPYDNGEYGYGYSEIRFTGMGPLIQVGIACMPFSFGWENSKW